jgi:uncharacterized repeat protein (TIGR03803 family)
MTVKGCARALYLSLAIAIATMILGGGALAQTESVLHTFQSHRDGQNPLGALVADKDGNLYGTTQAGGAGYNACGSGCGTIFEIKPPTSTDGHLAYSVLYRFQELSASDGREPVSPLILDASGNLYGSTWFGGTSDRGTVFELSPPAVQGGAWTETILYNFTSSDQSIGLRTPLLFDSQGNLYGESSGEPNATGSIFELSPPTTQGATWTYKLLYSFPADGSKGFFPQGGLIWGRDGNLYGVAARGGSVSFCTCGLVFQLVKPATPDGVWTQHVIHQFTDNGDGRIPNAVRFHGNILYGTTSAGGEIGSGGEIGGGTVFQLSPPATQGGAWTEVLLFTFHSSNSYGFAPSENVTFDQAGNLYTTTAFSSGGGGGEVFELSPPAVSGGAWTPTVLHNFTNGSDGGGFDVSALIFDKGNALFGVTFGGGSTALGVVFRLQP